MHRQINMYFLKHIVNMPGFKKTIVTLKIARVSLTKAAERSESRDRRSLEYGDKPSPLLQSLGKFTLFFSQSIGLC